MTGRGVLRFLAGMMLAGMGWVMAGGTAAAQTCAELNIATGGTVTQITQNNQTFCVHRFDGSGIFTLTQPRDVEYLIIGGGGGAGTGGGGAGGMLEGSGARMAASYTVTVGAGGAASTGGAGQSGGTSSVFGVSATGGGGGGRAAAGGNGLAGGSGGGAARNSNVAGAATGGAGIAGQGFAGADNVPGATNAGGGGGGAGGPGDGINGGPGRESSITGTAVTYAGGGASTSGTAAPFTNGAGGVGQDQAGGGGNHSDGPLTFLAGRAGVVILRYVANAPPTANAGPDVTVTEGATVTLNGLGSTDPENNIQSYAWTRVTGTSGTLSNENTAQASFVAGAPAGSSETLTFRLTVTDAFGLSTTDDIRVTVLAASNPPPPAAGGGNSVFDYLDPATQRTFRVHVFEQNGTFALDQARTIDYLIVGGGGGGGAIAGGGGGAGGLREGTQTSQAAGSYPVIVGLGGAGDNRTSTPNAPVDGGGNGNPSSVFGVEAAGGGGGGTFNFQSFNGAGRNGGSGGGASHQGPPGQPNPSGQGSVGGTGTSNTGDSSGGGGGGAGRAGGDGTAVQAGRGGDGVSSDITGSPVFYAGGGAGGGDTRGDTVLANVGGLGGGGASTNTAQIAGSGAPGTGGGGAGGWVIDSVVPSTGGNGGSGVVILRYVVNTPPVANAGPDANAFAGLEFTLNGTGSTDAENNITSYQWVQTGGMLQSLTGADTAQARFTPGQPASGTSEELRFTLTVTDAFGAQSTDTVVITLQGTASLTATKTARVFSEDGSGCADVSAASPATPVNPAAIPGACIEYTITVDNTGPVAATAITLTDVLPPELTYVAERRSNWAASTLAVSGNTVILSDGTITAGQTATLILRARVN